MRCNVLSALCVLVASAAGLSIPSANDKRAAPLDFRAVTFNIRYAAPGSTYERPWSVRKTLVTALLKDSTTSAIRSASVPVVGLQEVLKQQLQDVKKGLGSDWSHIGTGRDDGKEKGEYVPILYQPSVLRLVASTQKWLSLTPDVPSFWPGAGSRRYVIVGVFEVVKTGQKVVVANTHLDNASLEARVEGIKLALKTIRDVLTQHGANLPVILTGDFNSVPGTGDAYGTVEADGLLKDLRTLATAEQRFGPEGTFTDFDPANERNDRLDFVWLGPDAATTWAVRRYEVLGNVVKGVYMSDHRAVQTDITLR